ncbi:MAG: hypothetical protein AABX33_01180 [Nanoarchaeota archaeon]
MVQGHANLRLYCGLVNDGGLGEGRFYYDSDNEEHKRRYMHGIKTVQKYLHLPPSYKWGLQIVGHGNLVDNEQDAQSLIKHAEANIPGSHGLIELLDSAHGHIQFVRGVQFMGAFEDERAELIERMKEAGYSPRRLVENEELIFRYAKALIEPKDYEKRLETEIDKAWNAALQFHIKP